MLIHTNMPYTQMCSYTKAVSHTYAFTYRRNTQTLLRTHTDAFTNNFAHNPFYTPMLLHTDWHFCTHYAFTRKRFNAHTLLRTAQALSHKHFYTETLLHTHTRTPFTHKHVYLAMLPKECHFEPLFDLVMLLQPLKKNIADSACGEAISVFLATGQCYLKMLLTKPT